MVVVAEVVGTNVVVMITEGVVVLVGAFDVIESVVVVAVVVVFSFDLVVFTLWVVRPFRVAAMEKENYFMYIVNIIF